MLFLFTLAAFIVLSVYGWINGHTRMVLGCWLVWVVGFFALPHVFASGWPLLSLQGLLAFLLYLRWKLDAVG
jgi:hypothetical protein